MEELAKASILRIKSINNQIKINNLDEYFRSHSLKHKSIYKIFLASLDLSSNKDNNKTDKNEINKDFLTAILIIIIGVIIYFLNKDSKLTNKTANINSLESMRKSGFYVGFDSNNRKWEIPNEIIDKENYTDFKIIVDSAFETREKSLFKKCISTKNIIEFTDKLEDDKIITEHLKDILKNMSSEESNL